MLAVPLRRFNVAERLIQVDGRPSGFDYMRLVLAVGVIALHSVIVCYGQMAEIAFWHSPLRPLLRLILPAFFALSGFLVAGSLMRVRTVSMFLCLRAIRIFPALAIEVFLSALILGPLFTSLPLVAYFSSPLFYAYFWNMVGHVHFALPGVFAANPNAGVVNGQLWTVPYELYCYVSLTILALLGSVRSRWIVPAGGAAITVAYLAWKFATTGTVLAIVSGPVPGALLVVCFLSGVTIYLYRDAVPYNSKIAAAAAAAALPLIAFVPYGDYLAPLPIAYLTIYLGLSDPPRSFVVSGADYSYGLFLYGYPIQQVVAAAVPLGQLWYLNILATVAIGTLFAAFSWRVVEKPALQLRGPLARLEDLWLSRRTLSTGDVKAESASGMGLGGRKIQD